mmetsp:Transcript_8988/g.10413  ORF Transcript_8988/g.10413 Transcript_8988/m.10413 type:complete len:192 (-) Transcript_8988:307-882(-)
MENLKSGDVPALVTNIELKNILSKRLSIRREEEEAAAELGHGTSETSRKNRSNGKLRHRDFIEEKVYEYLSGSACTHTDIKELPTLVSKLKQKNSSSTYINSNNGRSGDNKMIKSEEGTAIPVSLVDEVKTKGYGLTDAEILQVLNLMPTEPVEIHLIIEDLASRLNEDEINEMLQLISTYYVNNNTDEEG